jgi:tripartite-type tricarboxylate transporter receptor subunit TctC
LYAQDSYPDRPVSIIVPITPGGPNDLVARYLAERLSMRMHGNFVVENRPGGSHIIGMNQVARAKPDGYTLLQASSNMSMNPAVRDDLPFDSEVDFQAISLTHETPLAVSVGSALNINTLADLVEMIRRDPSRVSYGTTGVGSSQRMATLLLLSKLGLNGLQEVAYRGSSQAHPDLISNRIDFMIDPVAAVLPHVKNNRLKILAVTTSERLALVPYVPTVAEALGIDYRVTSWGGIFAPKGTSQEIVQKLNRDLAAILNDQSTKTRMLELGLIARNSTPQELEVHVSSEINQWKKVVADAK